MKPLSAEEYEERIAIMQYCGGLTEPEAISLLSAQYPPCAPEEAPLLTKAEYMLLLRVRKNKGLLYSAETGEGKRCILRLIKKNILCLAHDGTVQEKPSV